MRPPDIIRLGKLIGWGAIALIASSCRQAPWLTAAEKGSLPELQKSVERAQLGPGLNRRAVEALATAVLEREIRSSTDPDGETSLGQLQGCAAAVEQALLHRAVREDETAGAALKVLVSAGRQLSVTEWHAALASASGARRAAAALDTQSPDRWNARERLLNDTDARVRREALKSVQLRPAKLHWESLVAILRLDPDPVCRHEAARALGIIGESRADSVLWDAWARADRDLRLGLVSGWAQARTFAAGGEQRLVAIARSEPGQVGAFAAAALASGHSAARWHGQARISRSLEFGTIEERAIALSAASWSLPEHSTMLLELGLHGDAVTRIRAFERWLEQPTHRWPATTWLRQLAAETSSSGLLARAVLARAGDASVRLLLREQLGYATWQSRAQSAHALWQLGDTNGVAKALTDDAPAVRVATACLVLADDSQARTSRSQ